MPMQTFAECPTETPRATPRALATSSKEPDGGSRLSMHGMPATKRAGDKLQRTSIGSSSREWSDKYRSMSASAIEDADDALPLRGADRPAGTTLEIAAGKKSQPKARTKRPRPIFDDGSVTRVFKFPSKAYPRSSYYVT